MLVKQKRTTYRPDGDFAAKYGWVKDSDVVDCPTCRTEGRGGWPVSPAVGKCRRCGWKYEKPDA